jgi:hypothetical protein
MHIDSGSIEAKGRAAIGGAMMIGMVMAIVVVAWVGCIAAGVVH